MKKRVLTVLTLGLLMSVSVSSAGVTWSTSDPDSWEIGAKIDGHEFGANETPDGVTWYGNEWTF